jgi:crotonobetainyl-CoA:carnitine CoA-transferase CaiB-like acyl-CoA transferase
MAANFGRKCKLVPYVSSKNTSKTPTRAMLPRCATLTARAPTATRLALRRRLSTPAGPLAGVKVLDLTRILAGPMCTQTLGDLGADVWKVERPGAGDDTRAWGPPFAPDGSSTYFLGANRNKRSIAIDLKSPEGVALLKRLARRADVLVENFVPGKAEELGIGYDALSRENPSLIYASISGYGQDGPYGAHPGYDVIASALGGLMSVTGTEEEACKTGVALVDQITGLHVLASVNAALFARERCPDRRGQKIDCSLLDSCAHSLANLASSQLNALQPPPEKRYGTAHESIVPYQAFEAEGGVKMILGAGNERQWRLLCEAIGGERGARLLADPRFGSNAARVEHRTELLPELADIFAERPLERWRDLLRGKIPWAPLNSVREVFRDPQVAHNGLVVSMEAGAGEDAQHEIVGASGDRTPFEVRMVRAPAVLHGTPTSVRRPPPSRSGAHTKAVLREVLGMDAEAIDALASDGVVGV